MTSRGNMHKRKEIVTSKAQAYKLFSAALIMAPKLPIGADQQPCGHIIFYYTAFNSTLMGHSCRNNAACLGNYHQLCGTKITCSHSAGSRCANRNRAVQSAFHLAPDPRHGQ